MLYTPNELFKKIIKNYKEIGLSWNDDLGEWTKKLLGYFYDLGKEYEYDVYMDSKLGKNNTHEHLVDLCWVFEKDQGTWLELAIEEEWDRHKDEIIYDFHKLLDVKAKLKVMICFPYEKNREDIPVQMAKEILNQGIKVFDEKYLIIIFSRNERRKPSERIKLFGYEFNYMGDELNKFESKWLPDNP